LKHVPPKSAAGLIIRRALPAGGAAWSEPGASSITPGRWNSDAVVAWASDRIRTSGCQTFTWMIGGRAVMHRDSLGNEQLITPGQVNLMTAGRGIAHAEDSESAAGGRLHAVQLWIALPDGERHRAPAFRNYPHLPSSSSGGFSVRVLAAAPSVTPRAAEVYSPLVGLDLAASGPARISVPLTASFEHAALVLSGAASIEDEALTPGTLLYLGSARERLALTCEAAVRIILVGGAPFGETHPVVVELRCTPRARDGAGGAGLEYRAAIRRGPRSPSPRLTAPEATGLHLRPGQVRKRAAST